MAESTYKKFLSPLDQRMGNYAPTRHHTDEYANAQQTVYIEELKKVNEELKQARRAALNIMEDTIASREALRESEEKYRTLFNSIDEGFCIIKMLYNDEGKAFNWRYLQVNNAFEINNGLHDAEGKTILELAPDIEPKWIEIYNSVAQTGEPLRFEEDSAALKRIFSLYAFRIGNPDDRKIAVIFTDITQRKKAEKSLRESEERKAFLLKLADAIGAIFEPVKIQETITRFTMEHFAADRCYYCEIEAGKAIISRDALKEGLPSVAGEYSLSEMPILTKVIGARKPFVVYDIHSTDLIDESLREICIPLQVISFIDIPVVKNGKSVGVFCIVQSTRRDWQDFEVDLAKEIAERTWAAVERAKIEEASRENEARKEFLLKLNDSIRHLEDPLEIQYEASRLVAEQLEADRVHFAEIINGEQLLIHKDYVRGETPSFAGTVKPKVMIAAVRLDRDEPVVITDTQAFPLLSDEEKATLAAAKIRSQLSVALSKSGKKVASFSVDQTTPRQWKPLEVSILQEAAEHTWNEVERAKAEQALRESQALLAKELADTKTLQQISSRIVDEGNVNALYEALLNSAKELMGSDCASIQILNPRTNHLMLAASQGLHPKSVEFWKNVHAGSGTSCGKALERRKRVVISDVDHGGEVSKDDLEEYHRSGIVATQSTPLISRSGKCVGMMSTHWKSVHEPSERKLGLFELLTRQVADVIERKQAEDALRYSKERLQKAIQVETVGVIFFNDDFEIVEANRAFLEMTGYSSERVNHAGLNLNDITPPEWIPAMRAAVQQIMTNGIAIPYERELTCADGTRIWALCAKARISENDNIEYIIDVTKRREAEEALRQNEERFRTLTNAVPQVIWTNDGDGKANFFNDRWYTYSGLNYEESVGVGWEAIVHTNDAPASKALWQKALAEGNIFDTEYRLRRYDGEYRWHIGRNIPLKNAEGKITSWFGSATDIEELKQTENALRESEAKMKITFESSTDFAIITIDKDCHIETWNSGAEKIFGYNEDEVKGKLCHLIFTPEDIADHVPENEMKRARETGHAADDRWHIRRNGERFFVSGVTSPIYDNDGLSGYVKVARDMTEKRQAEEIMRIWEERYRIALLSAEMGAWDWDIPEGKVIWNEQQYLLLGLPFDNKEKTLDDFLQLVLKEDKEQLTRNLQTAKKGNDVFQMEFRIKRADNNEIRWMNKFGLVVTRKDNRAARMIGVMYDITERKRLEQQKEDFIGIASHELKTPVTSIKGYTELLQEMCNAGDYAAGVPLIPKLSAQVDRLIDLVHTLLDISKMAAGELPLTIEEFGLKQLVEESAESLQQTTKLCHIIIQPNKEILIHADRERISQVLTNLISNAVKYSPNGGNVTINWRQLPDGIEVSVRDEGIGISKEMQEKVFDRFFRVSDVKSKTFPGMGLGLYIIRNLVRRHGGRIWVESEPGKGSVFYFILPD